MHPLRLLFWPKFASHPFIPPSLSIWNLRVILWVRLKEPPSKFLIFSLKLIFKSVWKNRWLTPLKVFYTYLKNQLLITFYAWAKKLKLFTLNLLWMLENISQSLFITFVFFSHFIMFFFTKLTLIFWEIFISFETISCLLLFSSSENFWYL